MLYLSIESRKGGVGKTTVALTLAETLLDHGYQVLMFDMDIVGTTLDPSFIDAHAVKIHNVNLDEEAVNLVHIFKKVYMSGKVIPPFALKEEKKNHCFSYERDKCNYIGSNIYDPKKNTLLEDPRILYDAFHAYWVLEFVKSISRQFASAIGFEDKTAIILDNSPGFSSFENIIHEYLTDLGPEKGKILLVSSMDPQDLDACRQSKGVIETLFNDKVKAGEYYRYMVEKGLEVNGDYDEYVERPAFKSVWNSLCASGGHFPVYHSKEYESVSPFVGILVNKVPKSISKELFKKDYFHNKDEVSAPFLTHLLYYFSSSVLLEKEIEYQKNNAEQFDRFKQSGHISSIEVDNKHYLGFLQVARHMGRGDFFKKEWEPLAHFNELISIINDYGPSTVDEIRHLESFVGEVSSTGNVVTIVEKFVRGNTAEESPILTVLPTTIAFVSGVLSEMEGKTRLDFHPDHPKLQEYENFVTSIGLASYRLYIYGQFCDVLNKLICLSLEDLESFEKLDTDLISKWIDEVLEGKIVESDINEKLVTLLSDRRNARELGQALNSIIKLWGL